MNQPKSFHCSQDHTKNRLTEVYRVNGKCDLIRFKISIIGWSVVTRIKRSRNLSIFLNWTINRPSRFWILLRSNNWFVWFAFGNPLIWNGVKIKNGVTNSRSNWFIYQFIQLHVAVRINRFDHSRRRNASNPKRWSATVIGLHVYSTSQWNLIWLLRNRKRIGHSDEKIIEMSWISSIHSGN